jgi:hypothetical protein
MPLQMKTVRETAAELGMSEAEVKVMVDSRKIRASLRKGQLVIAPDEIAKLKRLRKTLQDSARSAPPAAPPAKTAAPGTQAPKAAARPAAARPAVPKPPPKPT